MKRLLILLCLPWLPAHAAETESRPNFLWIIAEDVSPLFGSYGAPDARTPQLDALAARSHRFETCFATAPVCSPSRSALASGMYPTTLGTPHMFSDIRLPEVVEPLHRILKREGYWTALRGKTCFNFDDAGLIDYWKQDTAPWRECPEGKPFFSYMNLGATHEGSGNLSDRAAAALERLPEGARHEPSEVELPPYYPDTPEMRRIWARYLELLTVWDRDVGEVLATLEADGHAEDTIVFVFADHGMGLPRYKRWLYRTGLQVPLIVHVPEKYRHLTGGAEPGVAREELVSLLDLPATVLAMAGIEVPAVWQSRPLFTGEKREFLFGARDRLDDLPDLSRSVFDGRYHYIRHYQPQRVMMREGTIMSDYKKESHIELKRVHNAGEDSEESAKLWAPKPHEELYDLEKDPHELNNLAADPGHAAVKGRLAGRLREWILETRDCGFASEVGMLEHSQAEGVAPYEWLQDESAYPLQRALAAAEAASDPEAEWLEGSEDPILDYWAVQQRLIRGVDSDEARGFLTGRLGSDSAAVRLAAAEALAELGEDGAAVPVFRDGLEDEHAWVRLYAARALAVSLDDPGVLEKEIRARLTAIEEGPQGPNCRQWHRSTEHALWWALIKAGAETPESLGLK